MATQNAVNMPLPISVDNGGTSLITITDHGILIGSDAAAITPLAAGATGTLVGGSTGADPACVTSSDGDFTFTSAAAGTDRILTISNTDDSDAGSSGTLQLTTGGASAGDPAIKFTVTGTTNYSIGIDNSATGDPLKISNSTALGTTDSWIMTTAGERTLPLQPAFLVWSDQAYNVTGDGTVYAMQWQHEIFDRNNDFASNIFTSPVTGCCRISGQIFTWQVASGHTSGYLLFITSNRTYRGNQVNAGVMAGGGSLHLPFSVLADMDTGDTCSFSICISGSTKVVDVGSVSGTDLRGPFCGHLVC